MSKIQPLWMSEPIQRTDVGRFLNGTFFSAIEPLPSTPIGRALNAEAEVDQEFRFDETKEKVETILLNIRNPGRNSHFGSASHLSEQDQKFVEVLKKTYTDEEIVAILEEVTELEENAIECDGRLRQHYYVNY